MSVRYAPILARRRFFGAVPAAARAAVEMSIKVLPARAPVVAPWPADGYNQIQSDGADTYTYDALRWGGLLVLQPMVSGIGAQSIGTGQMVKVDGLSSTILNLTGLQISPEILDPRVRQCQQPLGRLSEILIPTALVALIDNEG
jgi:hypothetical protein